MIVAIALAASGLCRGLVWAEPAPPLIGYVDPTATEPPVDQSAGCYFWQQGDELDRHRYVFLLEYLNEQHPWMNIKGTYVRLDKAKTADPKINWPATAYTAGDVKVELSLKITSGGSEGNSQQGDLTVTSGSEKETMKIEGGCGS